MLLRAPSGRLADVVALERGILSLVGTSLDELPFVRDLKAVVAVANGAAPIDVARRVGITRKRLETMAGAAEREGVAAVLKVKDEPRPAFNMIRTLFIGRVTEEVFRIRYEDRIKSMGLGWEDRRASRTEIDYTISRDVDAVDVNVKNASEPFRMVQKLGFDPKDCVPLGIYKLLQARKTATARKKPFVFTYLIDWGASAKVQDAARKTLSAEEIAAAEILLNVAESGQRKAQDVTIQAMFDRAKDELMKIANTSDDFRVVGWKKAFDILIEKFEERAPALTLPRAGWQGELGIFLQVSSELTPWEEVMKFFERQEFAEIGKRVDEGSL